MAQMEHASLKFCVNTWQLVPKTTVTTLPAQEFHIKTLLVNTELISNVFLWKYYLAAHSRG